jgi:hypothetical protein
MAQVGAFFDVDRTLVACNTGRLFLKDLRRRGEISFMRALQAMGWMLKYHLSLIDLDAVAAMLAGQKIGLPNRFGQITFSSSSVAAMPCAAVIAPLE